MAKSSGLSPQDLTKTDWYYEEPSYLHLIHEVRTEKGDFIRTDMIKIPWRKIEASLKRIRSTKKKAKR